MTDQTDLKDETIIEIPVDEADMPLDPIAALNAENQILATEIETLKDKHLRLLADMDNLRRRTQREIADGKVYAVTNFARDLLSVSDNLSRALEAVETTHDIVALTEGVTLTSKELLTVLNRHGVKEISPVGEKFDPNFHQAMYEVPTEELAPGHVMQVAQTGFVIGDRVLRPALVGVSKKG
jgi:molecular chaperone GrpE